MSCIHLEVRQEPLWPGLDAERVQDCGAELFLGMLVNGTASGRSVAVVRLDLPDGTVAVAQVPVDQLEEAVGHMRARERNLLGYSQKTRAEA